MNLKKTFLTVTLLLFVIITAGFSQVSTDKKAPDFTLPDMDGNNFQLSQNVEGKLTLINFWATWCMPCREEMKKLKKIQKKFKDKGLEIVCISVDDPKTVSKVKSFIKTNRYKFKVLLDTNNEVMRLYQVTNPPYTFLINEKGELIYTHSGYRKGDEKILEKKIAKLLEQ
ncbi:MAG: TlpA family protein disulfide reductase [Calditrichia bacterium]|nr:TlpA family protein disulfide reductase [Calditrichia bacterium]